MQTKYYMILMALCLFIAPSYGQKLKDKRVNVNYVSLPTTQLPDDYKTYSVSVYGSGLTQGGVNSDAIAKSITMDGFKRLSGMGSDFGHLRVYVHVGYLSIGTGESKSKTTTKKNKDGTETKKTNYWYSVPYRINTSYKIVDAEGVVLASDGKNENTTRSTGKKSSRSAAYESYKRERGRLGQGVARDAAQKIAGIAKKTLASKFDFAQIKIPVQFYLIKKDKSEAGFEQSYETAKTVFANASATTPALETKAQLADAMKFWVEQGNVDPKGDKKLVRIYEAANYNLAITHFYLDELDNAKLYADEVLKVVGKDRKSKNLLEKIEKTKELMAMHNIYSLHHQRDLSGAAAPSKVTAFEQEKEELAEANNSIDGTLTTNGEETVGKVMQDKDAESLMFGESGNVKFMVEGASEMKEYDLTAADVTAFTLGDRSFSKLNFSPCAKGKAEAKLHIMEELYASDKITLYQYYPSNGALGGDKTEFAYLKKGEEMPVSLLDTQFLIFDKGMAKYFADCTDLTNMCTNGDLKMNKDDLTKAARIYSELCE